MSKIATAVEDAVIKKDGSDKIIGVASFTVPDIEFASEEVSGLGVGKFESVIPTSANALSLLIKFIGSNENLHFGKGKGVNLVATAVILGNDTETHDLVKQALTCTCKGTVKKIGGGEFSKAGKLEPEIEIALTYFKKEIDGKVLVEIDVFNQIFIIDEEDLYAEVKNLLN